MPAFAIEEVKTNNMDIRFLEQLPMLQEEHFQDKRLRPF
jgi:hypothetical protein